MRLDDGIWLRSINPASRLTDERSTGKWLIYGEREQVERWFSIIDALVQEGSIHQAKYAPRRDVADPLRACSPMICVYADDPSRKTTLDLLVNRGIIPSQWKYEWETRRDWSDGGALKELAERLELRRQESTAPTDQFP